MCRFEIVFHKNMCMLFVCVTRGGRDRDGRGEVGGGYGRGEEKGGGGR